MTDSFHLSFSNAEHELYLHLKSMGNTASGYLKSCIKTHHDSTVAGTIDDELPAEDHYQAMHIEHMFNRIYGDIITFPEGESGFIHLNEYGSTSMQSVMTNRKTMLIAACKNDLILADKVLDYAKNRLPKLSGYM